ncbi:GNAT family N-acetyltransferase [Planctomycetota bacterium]
MEKEIIFKKTTELTEKEKTQIIDVFQGVFEREMSTEFFDQRFFNSFLGYSYHGLMLNNSNVVGCFSAIPYRYKYFGKNLTFGLSVDTMIATEHRGGKANLVKMADIVYEAMIDDNIPLIYGFPNDLYYSHEKRILGTRDIGKLNYYILPLNISAIAPKMKIFNSLSRLVSKMAVRLSQKRQALECRFNIDKIDDKIFEKHRYNNSYSFIKLKDNAKCIYKTYKEVNGARTLYLLDVSPMNPVSFEDAVKRIYELERDSVDVIIYVGSLPFKPAGLFKVPESMEPQKIRMTAKILIPEIVNESVFEIENWKTNISNFDVR